MNREPIEIPDLPTGQHSNSEYFGSASNFSFVNQLNHLLKPLNDSKGLESNGLERFGMKPTILEHSWSFDFSLENFCTESMNKLLMAYLETWGMALPIFLPSELFELASDTWMNPHATAEDRALLYLVLSVGAATSYFGIEESSPNAFPVARGFYNLAFQTLPTIFSQVSFEAVRIIFFMCLCACSLGDTALSYSYSGIAVRVLAAIGLHKNSAVKKLAHSFGPPHHRRAWATIWQFEKYWSFCVGRPSGLSDYVNPPQFNENDFKFDGYGELGAFRMTAEHLRLRLTFGTFLMKIHGELYNSKSGLLTIIDKIEHFSKDIDDSYFGSSDPLLIQTEITDEVRQLPKERVIEWFWIRIYYLYLKLIIFRPFLVFRAYLDNTRTQIPSSLRDKMEIGADNCVEVAIELSDFIIKLNNKVRMIQPIIFISTYLESTSTVLLFYIVSSYSSISDPMARKLWDALQDTKNFLNGLYGSYLDSTKILARDGLESLYGVLRSRGNDKSKTYLDKIMVPISATTPPASTSLEAPDPEKDLEEFWLQTLEWINFA